MALVQWELVAAPKRFKTEPRARKQENQQTLDRTERAPPRWAIAKRRICSVVLRRASC
jgi:hypothetical protein